MAAPGRGASGAGSLVPVALVVGSMVSLQFGASAATELFPTVGSAGASMLRLTLSAVVLSVVTPPRWREWSRHQVGAVMALGVSLAAMNSAFYAAVDRLPLGIAVTIEFLGPLTLAAVLSRRWADGAWVALALGGVALLGLGTLGTVDALDGAGVVLALVAGGCWAAYIVTASRLGAAGTVRGGLAGASIVAGVLTFPTGVVAGGGDLVSWRVLGLGLLVAVLASVVPYSFELQALRTLSKKTFSVLVALEPAVGAVVGALLLDQRLRGWSVVAIGLVVVAGIGATATARREPEAPDLPPVMPSG